RSLHFLQCDIFCTKYKTSFFFSSSRRHTRWPRDWSSDVCSSDLKLAGAGIAGSVLQRGGQVIDGQIARGHRGRVRLDANGRLSAIDGDLAYPRENANALADLRIGVVEQLALRGAVASDPHVHDGLVVQIGFGEGGRAR